mmetsp:Transcript_88667/g.275669  ORF Transcript_88667/g.275669 Transcript_88667/m.275669 type:complete len:235 (-) Transcript_88667:108-812(-)
MPPPLLRPGSALRRNSSEATSPKPMEQDHWRREQPACLGSHQFGSRAGNFRKTSRGARCICSRLGPPSLWIMASASSFLPSPTRSAYLWLSKSGFTSMGCCISCISSASGRWLLFRNRMFGSLSSSSSGQYSLGLTSSPVALSMMTPLPPRSRASPSQGLGLGLSGAFGSGAGHWKSAGAGLRNPVAMVDFFAPASSRASILRSSLRMVLSSCWHSNSLSAASALRRLFSLAAA